MWFHTLDMLEASIGKRTGVAADQAVETVFFFDDFNALDARGEIGRAAVHGLIDDRLRLGESLATDFGLKLHGFAMVDGGLDLDVPVGAQPSCGSGNYLLPCSVQWHQLTKHRVLRDETVPAHIKAELDAVLHLPRLAALVIQGAEHNPTPLAFQRGDFSMEYLHMCLPLAMTQFLGVSALSGRVDSEMQCWSLSVNCVRLMVFPPRLNTKCDAARSLVAELGLAVPHFDLDDRCVIEIGAAQRLLLRRLFWHLNLPRPFVFSGFKVAVAHFLLLAVAASDGKKLSTFIGCLNVFFSHSAQYEHDGNRISRPIVKVADGLATHVLRTENTTMTCLMERKTVEVSPEVAMVVVNELHGHLPWDVQLVLPVTAPGGDKVEHVTFNIDMIPVLAMSFAEAHFDDLETKAATAPAVVLGSRHAGYAAVVGGLQREEGINEGGAPVWHVNTRNPGSLGVVPFPPGCTDEVRLTVHSVLHDSGASARSAWNQ